MKFKKLLSLSTAFLVSASILTGCGSNKGTEKNDISVGIVLGAGSINHLTNQLGKGYKKLRLILE